VTPKAFIVLAAWSSGCLPPDASPKAPAAADPAEAALMHPWRVDGHLLGKRTSLSNEDATQSHGRTVSINRSGYSTPWHGTCEEAGSTRRERPLAEVAAELAIVLAGVLRHGFTDPLVEHRLSCTDPVRRAPSLTVYVANAHALTCYSGICYVLAH
jgi:hypothetical protein